MKEGVAVLTKVEESTLHASSTTKKQHCKANNRDSLGLGPVRVDLHFK